MPLKDSAPAKINLTLFIHGRRADGYHELESLVVFADLADALALEEQAVPSLTVAGPTAQLAGPEGDNLVLKAVAALQGRVPGLRSGAFVLDKHLPVAAGIGGGSADAAAALRLLARLNGIAIDDLRLIEAARSVGADVPVCLTSQVRIMRGAGERLGKALTLPRLHAVLVNPGVPVETAAVFRKLGLAPGTVCQTARHTDIASAIDTATLTALVASGRNDLEPAAIAVEPLIGEVLAAISAQPGCQLARMSGSGATCFGLFPDLTAVFAAVRALRRDHRDWWIQPATLGALDL